MPDYVNFEHSSSGDIHYGEEHRLSSSALAPDSNSTFDIGWQRSEVGAPTSDVPYHLFPPQLEALLCSIGEEASRIFAPLEGDKTLSTGNSDSNLNMLGTIWDHPEITWPILSSLESPTSAAGTRPPFTSLTPEPFYTSSSTSPSSDTSFFSSPTFLNTPILWKEADPETLIMSLGDGGIEDLGRGSTTSMNDNAKQIPINPTRNTWACPRCGGGMP